MATEPNAFKTLVARLKKQWNDSDLVAFGELAEPDPLALLKQAEKWRANHSKDAVLLIVCATLCMRAELYGKARAYLQASLEVRPHLETYRLLAHLLEHIDERERAYKVLKEALAYAIGRDMPLPKIAVARRERRKPVDRRR
ncbi:MAG: hypothetical protein H7Y02_07750 [Candidatus Obscuribacterales bacterium]|nr:hypothetical protein [Steroidobacteraceae bacterium]